MPKAKISREMVVDAAFEVTRAVGIENVNARTVSEKLRCSTQPVMYYFSTIEELKRAVYEKTDNFHTEYLMNSYPNMNPILSIGLNYVRFAIKEPHLFRLLFQSGYAVEDSLIEMIDSPELIPVISAMREALSMDEKQTKRVFLIVAMFTHGYASIIANNSLEYDENVVAGHLELAFRGAVLAVKEEKSEKAI